jgi:hypothetical protein
MPILCDDYIFSFCLVTFEFVKNRNNLKPNNIFMIYFTLLSVEINISFFDIDNTYIKVRVMLTHFKCVRNLQSV